MSLEVARKVSSTEGELTRTRKNGQPKEGGGQILLREEAIVHRGGWVGACDLQGKLILERLILKAMGGEGIWIGIGIHLS